jgi:hypothetical protein
LFADELWYHALWDCEPNAACAPFAS